MPESTCQSCGSAFEQPQGRRGPLRKLCTGCSPRRRPRKYKLEHLCTRCGCPSKSEGRCSRCRLVVACDSCGGEASISGADYNRGKRTAVCRSCRRSQPKRADCGNCGRQFWYEGKRQRKYCSQSCASAAQPNTRVTVACEVCGQSFTRLPSALKRAKGRYCSRSCSARATSARLRPPQDPPAPSERVYFPACKMCGNVFCARVHQARYCSARCKIDEANVRVSGLYALATQFVDGRYVGRQWRVALLEYLVDRDGDKCGICKRKVDITLKSGTRGSRRGPSVDHIIPRSIGGTDDLENLRLAHWGCNQKRSNRGGGEQLALVG